MDGKVALCEEIYEKGLETLGCRRSLYLPFEKKDARVETYEQDRKSRHYKVDSGMKTGRHNESHRDCFTG